MTGCWLFNEGLGTTAYDLAGRTVDGSLQGSAAFAPRGLSLPGASTDFVDIGSAILLSTTTPFSVVAGVNLDAFGNGWSCIVSLKTTGGTDKWRLFASNQSGYLPVTFGQTNATSWARARWNTAAAFPTGENHQIIVTFDGVDYTALSSFKLYWDGLTKPLVVGSTYTATNENNKIGCVTTYPWDGMIYYVYLYNRVLTPAESLQTYQNPYQMLVL